MPQTDGPPRRISRRTAFEVSRISATLSVSPPSKRMIATAIVTTGKFEGDVVHAGRAEDCARA